jgi:hypothetical protein
VGLRPRPAFAVGLGVHLAVPPQGLAVEAAALEPLEHEVQQADVGTRRPPAFHPVVDVRVARPEAVRLLGVVQEHAVDDEVRVVLQDLLEGVVEPREIGAAAAPVEDLPPAGIGLVQQGLEPPRVGVGLLDPLAFGEGIAEYGHAADAWPLPAELFIAELQAVEPQLHREGRAAPGLVEAADVARFVYAAAVGIAQVHVEVAPRVRRIAVEGDAHAPVAQMGGRNVRGGNDTEGQVHGQQGDDDGTERQRRADGPFVGLPEADDPGRWHN